MTVALKINKHITIKLRYMFRIREYAEYIPVGYIAYTLTIKDNKRGVVYTYQITDKYSNRHVTGDTFITFYNNCMLQALTQRQSKRLSELIPILYGDYKEENNENNT